MFLIPQRIPLVYLLKKEKPYKSTPASAGGHQLRLYSTDLLLGLTSYGLAYPLWVVRLQLRHVFFTAIGADVHQQGECVVLEMQE